MSPKFLVRTFRNLVFRKRPYFAHLAITHTCNLRCSFCHIPEDRVEEVDTAGMKRIINRLDRMGIAVLSISGGGEPLLRKDFAAILNHAAAKGLYTKITSNGTMSQAKYAELLASRVTEIAISLDGVRGNELPFSHVGPKILDSLRYLNNNLPQGKSLTINVTISSKNRDQVDEIVAYCTREFPRARLWLNPVVVGQGKLRVPSELKVNPDYLRRVDSPTLLTPGFYKQGAEDYYRSETYNWGCLAGEMFFDIKPNGDLWICQDHPSRTLLNILDPDFDRKYREADFSHRRACSGCTYSCYWITQKSFEPRNWPGMAGMWWKSTTQPDEPCRQTEQAYGWAAGLLHFSATRLLTSTLSAVRTALWVTLVAVLVGGRPAGAQSISSQITSDEVIARMEQANQQRRIALRSYQSRRRYFAANPRLRRQAYLLVEANLQSPGEIDFRVVERGGSRAVERRVFKPMLETEQANAHSPSREAVEICRRNYTFTFSEYDSAAHAYVFKVEPRTTNKYLLRGSIWVNVEDFAIQRIEGEPAQRPSFWVRRTHFVHEYAKFGEFWFPIHNRTEVELLLFGRSTMGIDYFDYSWQSRDEFTRAASSFEVESLPLHAQPQADPAPQPAISPPDWRAGIFLTSSPYFARIARLGYLLVERAVKLYATFPNSG